MAIGQATGSTRKISPSKERKINRNADSPLSQALDALIRDFSIAHARDWLRLKFDSFDSSVETPILAGATSNESRYIDSAQLLGCIRSLPDGVANAPVLAVAVRMKGELVERSSRVVQLSFAKRLLKEAIRGNFVQNLEGLPAQGIFLFYDDDGYFRLSLVTGTVGNRRMSFNDAKRQSFYSKRPLTLL